jgi:nucleoside-diphosphate-sugar epimerase
MKVLVTGGAGYIASALIPMLETQGDRVLALDNLRTHGAVASSLTESESCSFIRADVRDAAIMRESLADVDAVVHLAALVGYPACAAHPKDALSINLHATAQLASLIDGKIPWVFASTASVYGRVLDPICTETHGLAPKSLYSQSKAQAEEHVLQAGGTVLRPVTAFGLAPQFRWDLLVHQFVQDALNHQTIEVYEGHACRPLIGVNDIARAIILCLNKACQTAGQVYNLATEQLTLTKLEIAARVAAATGAEVTEINHQHDPDLRDYRVDAGKLNALGFAAQQSLEDAIDKLCILSQEQRRPAV